MFRVQFYFKEMKIYGGTILFQTKDFVTGCLFVSGRK